MSAFITMNDGDPRIFKYKQLSKETKNKLKRYCLKRFSEMPFYYAIIIIFIKIWKYFFEKKHEKIPRSAYFLVKYLKERALGTKLLFIEDGNLEAANKIAFYIHNKGRIPYNKHNMSTLATALKIYIREYLKGFFPFETVMAISYHKSKRTHEFDMLMLLYAMNNDKKKFMYEVFDLLVTYTKYKEVNEVDFKRGIDALIDSLFVMPCKKSISDKEPFNKIISEISMVKIDVVPLCLIFKCNNL